MACCSAKWDGLLTSHCSMCCHTFTSVSAFDKHRVGSPGNRTCLNPETAADRKGVLVFADAGRSYPCWILTKDRLKARPDYFVGRQQPARLVASLPDRLKPAKGVPVHPRG